MIKYSIKQRFIEIERIKILITNLSTAMIATPINATIILFTLWNIVPIHRLLIWYILNVFFVVARYFVLSLYKRGYKKDKFRFWRIFIFLSLIISGFLFGSAGFLLIDPERMEYILFIYFILGGMVAGSLGTYHNSLLMYFSYSSTVFLQILIALVFIDHSIAPLMILLGLIYYTLMSASAIHMNQDLSGFLAIKYENFELVKNLNMEKNIVEKLNNELIGKNKRLKDLSNMDSLTGLKNRRYLNEVVSPEMYNFVQNYTMEKEGNNKRIKDKSKGFGVLIIDLDHFKNVNDRYGHDSGDLVLTQFSSILIKNIRANDVAVRIGGEEFVIILKNLEHKALSILAEKIRISIENSLFQITSNRTINITCSIGMIFCPFERSSLSNHTLDQVIGLADKALYYAKSHNRNVSVAVSSGDRNFNEENLIFEISR